MRVRDVMTKDVTTVRPDTSLKEVAEILAARGISGLPVDDGRGEVLGVVSEGDILFKERGSDERRKGLLGWLLDPHTMPEEAKLTARTAGEAMTSPVIAIGPDRPLAEAAARMIDRAVNRLPVIEDGKLVGILTRADLVRAFTRPDAEIVQDIRDEIVLRTLWIAPESLDVRVERGEVTLIGEVETKGDAELLPALVERVPGVVGVETRLTWRTDGNGRQRHP